MLEFFLILFLLQQEHHNQEVLVKWHISGFLLAQYILHLQDLQITYIILNT